MGREKYVKRPSRRRWKGYILNSQNPLRQNHQHLSLLLNPKIRLRPLFLPLHRHRSLLHRRPQSLRLQLLRQLLLQFPSNFRVDQVRPDLPSILRFASQTARVRFQRDLARRHPPLLLHLRVLLFPFLQDLARCNREPLPVHELEVRDLTTLRHHQS